jgi:hypothetical protein
LSSDSPDIVDVFTGRYQTTNVPSRDLCIATVLHGTIQYLFIYGIHNNAINSSDYIALNYKILENNGSETLQKAMAVV